MKTKTITAISIILLLISSCALPQTAAPTEGPIESVPVQATSASGTITSERKQTVSLVKLE